MGEVKHTPGPWVATSIDQGTGDYCIHAKGIPWQLAYLSENSQFEWPIEANARLIAAAPDMLAALKQVRDFDAKNAPALMGLPWFKTMHEAVFVAIAAAEGR